MGYETWLPAFEGYARRRKSGRDDLTIFEVRYVMDYDCSGRSRKPQASTEGESDIVCFQLCRTHACSIRQHKECV